MVYSIANAGLELRIYATDITSTETTASCPTPYVWTLENQDGSSVSDTFLTRVDYNSGDLGIKVETSDFIDVGTYAFVLRIAYDDTSYSNAGQIDITV
jgi:hypothetical protein